MIKFISFFIKILRGKEIASCLDLKPFSKSTLKFNIVLTIQLDYWINWIKDPFQLMNTNNIQNDERKNDTGKWLNLRVWKKIQHIATCFCWCWCFMSSTIGTHRPSSNACAVSVAQRVDIYWESSLNFHFNKQISWSISITPQWLLSTNIHLIIFHIIAFQ